MESAIDLLSVGMFRRMLVLATGVLAIAFASSLTAIVAKEALAAADEVVATSVGAECRPSSTVDASQGALIAAVVRSGVSPGVDPTVDAISGAANLPRTQATPYALPSAGCSRDCTNWLYRWELRYQSYGVTRWVRVKVKCLNWAETDCPDW